jgi:hypothetical protein
VSVPDHVTATRGPANAVVLTVYPHVGDPVRIELPLKQAALVGMDLLSLALEPVFRLEAESDRAGHGARPANPVGG